MKRKLITKKEIVSDLSKKTSLSFETCEFLFETLCLQLADYLQNEKGFFLPELGSFYLIDVRSSRSNMTGQIIPPHRRIRYKPNSRVARNIRILTKQE